MDMYLFIGFTGLILFVILLLFYLGIKPNFKIKMPEILIKKEGICKFLVCILIIVIGCGVGTQKFALRVNYHPELGDFIYKNYYNPLSILIWMWKYQYTLPRAVQEAIGYSSIFFMSFVFFLCVVVLKKEKLDLHGSARWAKIKEIIERKLLYIEGQFSDGVILGKLKKWTIIENDKTNIVLIAPTRSGKGVGVIIPTLLNWLGSTVVLDLKGENWVATSSYRKKVLKQKVLKFAPYAIDDSASYNPLASVRLGTMKESRDIALIANILMEPGAGKSKDHWSNSATSFLIGVITHVLYEQKKKGKVASLGNVVDFLTSPEKPMYPNRLQELKNYDYGMTFNGVSDEEQREGVSENTHPVVARMAAESLNKDEKEFAGILSSAMAVLTLFKDPIIRKNTSRVDFIMDDLLNYEVPVNLYVVIQADEQEALAPLVKMMITQIVGAICVVMEEVNGESPHKHRLMMMLDELPAFGKIDKLEEAMGYICGYGAKAVVIAQSLEQITQKYGKNSQLLSHCAVAVFYSPTPVDKETPKIISDILGEETVKDKSYSRKSGGLSLGGNISESKKAKKLLTPEEVRNKLGKKRNLITMANEYPIIANKIRYYENAYYRSKILPVEPTETIKR